jgi:hypothetical protein
MTTRIALQAPAAALILAATAVPVELRHATLANLYVRLNPTDILLNFLLYVPFGAVLAPAGFFRAVSAAAALSAVAETAQIVSANRFPGAMDVVANITGAAVGALLGSLVRVPRVALSKRLAALCLAAAAVLWTLQALPGRSAGMSNWDPGMALAAGDELTRNRPWQGGIEELAIRSGGAVLFGPERNLDLAALRGRPLLSGGAARELRDRIVAAGSFEVLVRFRSHDAGQAGPARIVTFSRDTLSRNFMLGQERRRLVFRVRTPVTGRNGLSPAATTAGVIEPGKLHTVRAAYDGAVSRLYLDGRLAARENLRAEGQPFPVLADVGRPAVAVALGILAAIGVAGLAEPRRRFASCAAAGLAAGAAVSASGGAMIAWTPLLGLAGAAVIAASFRETGPAVHREEGDVEERIRKVALFL